MKRRAFGFVCMVSLALCLAVCEQWMFEGVPGRRWVLAFDLHDVSGKPPHIRQDNWSLVLTRGLHFSWAEKNWFNWAHHQLVIPYVLPVVVLAILPTAWISGQLRHRRRRTGGLCAHCGYDLRASTHRCPECGHPIES